MAAIKLGMGGGATTGQSVTIYPPISGASSGYVEESWNQIIWRTPGTFSKMTRTVTVNGGTSGSYDVTFRINGADGNMAISVPFGVTGVFEDAINTDTVADGDLVNFKEVSPPSVGAADLTVVAKTCLFSATTDTVNKFVTSASSGSFLNTASTTFYYPIAGSLVPTTVESNFIFKTKLNETLKNLQVNVPLTQNASTNDIVVRTRINGVDGNQVITIPAGATGIFEDLVNTDATLVDDVLNYSVTTGAGTVSIRIMSITTELLSTSQQYQTVWCNAGLTAHGPGVTTYASPFGGLTYSTIEANRRQYAQVNQSVGMMGITVATNTIDEQSTLYFRVNGVNRDLGIVIPANTTGYFQDHLNVSNLVEGDLVDFQLATGATGTSISVSTISLLWAVPPTDEMSLVGFTNDRL